ncbi:MAG: ABC transporter substrate-binding protein [Promethearchaeota archaeon]
MSSMIRMAWRVLIFPPPPVQRKGVNSTLFPGMKFDTNDWILLSQIASNQFDCMLLSQIQTNEGKKMKKHLLTGLFLGILFLSLNLAPVDVSAQVALDIYIHETISGEPESLDPAVCYETTGTGIIQNVYDKLYTYIGSDTTLIPNVATGYTISGDGLTWTFTLRDDVYFADGLPLNASCVKYSLDRAILMLGHPYWMLTDFVKGANDYAHLSNPNVAEAEEWLAMEAITANDAAGTVTIKLDNPYTPFLGALTYEIGSIINPSYVYAHKDEDKVPEGPDYTFDTGNNDSDMIDMNWWFPALAGTGSGIVPGQESDWMYRHMAGSGPYMLKEWTPGEQRVLERNNNWWRVAAGLDTLPQIKEGYIKIVAETATRILDLKAGTCDSAAVPVTTMPEIYNVTTGEVLVEGLEVEVFPTWSVMYLGFNMNDSLTATEGGKLFLDENEASSTYSSTTAATLRRYSDLNPDTSMASPGNPFTALKFRQAMAHAFDYEQHITAALNGWGIRMVGVIPKDMFGHQPDLEVPTYNPTLAKALFQEVDWKGDLIIGYASGGDRQKQACLILKAGVEALDVGITIDVQDWQWSVYLDHIRGQHLPFFYLGWAPDYADPDNYAHPFLHSEGYIAGRQKYSNAWIDDNITAAREEADATKRLALYKNIEEMGAADGCLMYMVQFLAYLVHQDNVMGYNLTKNPMQSLDFREIYKQKAITTTSIELLDPLLLLFLVATLVIWRKIQRTTKCRETIE